MKQPTNTLEFLDAIKAARRLPSDYALAKHFGIKQATISQWRHGRTVPDDLMAMRIAEALRVPAPYVLANIAAERAARADRPELSASWHAVARKCAAIAAAVLALLFVPELVLVDADQARAAVTNNIHYAQSLLFWSGFSFAAFLLFLIHPHSATPSKHAPFFFQKTHL